MNLSDEQLMLLEQLTYLDDSVYDAAGVEKPDFSSVKSVEILLRDFDDKALARLEAEGTIENASGGSEHVQGGEIAAIIREIKDDEDLYNLDIYEITESKDTHKRDTIVFYNADDGTDGEAIVAFRGTLDSEEWKDNFNLLVTGDTDINEQALNYIDEQLPFSSIATVGHSKGGNKAAYTYYLSDKVDRCVALDAPGLPLIFYELHPEAREKAMIEGGIQAYAVTGDFVNILMYPLFGARTKYCVGHGQDDYLENHSPTTFFNYQKVGRCTFIKKNDDGTYLMFTEQDEHMQKLHGFTLFAYQFMDEETKNQMVDYLGNAIVLAMDGTITVDGVTYTKDTLADYLLSDQDMLSTLLAYLMAYANEYDMDWDDIKVFISFFSVVRFGGWRIFTNAKSGFADGKGSTDYDDFIKWLDFVFNYKDIDCDAQALVDNAYDKYVEILKMDGMGEELSDYDMSPNFFPGTSITAPSDSFVPGPPDDRSRSGTSEANSEALYIDNNVYAAKRTDITNSAGELSFNTAVFDTENEVCGTESLVTLANYWHKTADTTNKYREFCINPLSKSMLNAQTAINITTLNVANALSVLTFGAMVGGAALAGSKLGRGNKGKDTGNNQDTVENDENSVWGKDNNYDHAMENGTVIRFHKGEAQQPSWEVDKNYDNDYAYDPNVKATMSDYGNWVYWGTLSNGAEFLNHLPDGVKTYEHYRDGNGEPLEIDYARAYNEDASIKANADRCVAETNVAVQEMIASGEQPPFSITSEFITASPYPETENWQKAIGGHQVWISADVSTGENGEVVVETTVHEMDRYNFNRGMNDIATGTPDDVNGRFEQLGWAHSFDTYGSVSFRSEFDENGEISVPEVIEGDGREARTRRDYAER